MAGTFFLVVGASGVGKDTLLDGARKLLAEDDRFHFVRRVITRPAEAGGEDHTEMSSEAFARARKAGEFFAHWSAHGLDYGLPIALTEELAGGRHVIANGSRATIADIAGRVENLVVIEITARPETIAQRLAARGRETDKAIAARLARASPPFPPGIEVVRIGNDSDPKIGAEVLAAAFHTHAAPALHVRALPIDTWREQIAYLSARSTAVAASEYLGPGRIEIIGEGRSARASVHVVDDPARLGRRDIGLSRSAFAALGLPEGAPVRIERTPSPTSTNALRAKIRGEELNEAQYHMLVGDIVQGRYPDREVAAFLVSATRALSDTEVLALARVRLAFAEILKWDEPIVVDKHSMGGIPGSRITMIVVPIVAAHGLAIPKTSSRAITSAAGTADAMETIANVELDVAEVRRVVSEARGCIAWNGRLNHSAVDDVMNAITRPLGIDSNKWSVASILSKKVAAGSTHVIIDLPFGARTKLTTRADADEVGRLFEAVGRGLGLVVEAHPTDGRHPIGRGIGPALEVRDVLWVLDNDPRAPADLREKALFFASRILYWDRALGSPDAARARAEALLASGAARSALDTIVAAQGRRQPPIGPAAQTHAVKASRSGIVTTINGWAIAGIARQAGAPSDRGAGLDLLVRVGARIRAGDPLYVIHASSELDLASAAALAGHDCGFTIAG
jgi:thymidine phosphorylase